LLVEQRGPELAQNIQKKRTIASLAAAIPWPVRIRMCESAVRKQDEWVFKNDPRFFEAIVAATEPRVVAAGATESLDFLVAEGCPRDELLYFLGGCENRGVTSALAMTHFDSHELPRVLKRIRKSASDIWKLNGGYIGHFFEYPENSVLYKFEPLAVTLREYSALVEHAVKYIGGKSDFYLSLAKAMLEEFVRERTKNSHDEKVVDLLAAMLGEQYAAEDHRNWRRTYQRRRNGYRPDPRDSASLRIKKTLLEVHAASGYRMDVFHPGPQYLRQEILQPHPKGEKQVSRKGKKRAGPKKRGIVRPTQ
jgi:hypothetical protein